LKSAFDEIRADEYSVANEAAQLGLLLINKVEEHEHLQPANIGYVFRDDEIRRRGKVVGAEAILVERILQSDPRYARLVKWAFLRVLGAAELPDFIVLIDHNIWEGLDVEQRLALVDHELSHCSYQTEDDGATQKFRKDGSPLWAVRGHDVEEFASVVQRNGLWNAELVTFARAIVDSLATRGTPAYLDGAQ
jgi:hypothetical protein